MLNLFNKTKPWLAASLLAATVAFAQDDNKKCRPQKGFDQGHEVMQNQMTAAYNAPARIEVRGSWDVYATGGFIYWQAQEDNLLPGYVSNNYPPYIAGDQINFTGGVSHNNLIMPNFEYKPGFKFGLGVNLDWDNLDAYAQYTWFHGTTKTTTDPVIFSSTVTPFFIFNNQQTAYNNQQPAFGAWTGIGTVFPFVKSVQTWDLKMDFLDVSLARSYYAGTKVSVRPFFGARGAWIRQKLTNKYLSLPTSLEEEGLSTAAYTGYPAAISDVTSADDPVPFDAYYNLIGTNSTASWGVGPRLGFDTNVMLGYGFRVIGSASADILYTRYDLRNNFTLATWGPPVIRIGGGQMKAQHLGLLRGHTDLEMGIGWGSYLDDNNWHIDFAATYGFQIFFDQNMFVQNSNLFVQAPNGNLYVHGLDLEVKLDF